MYPGGGPVRAATSCFGFPKVFFDNLHEFPLSKVDSLLSGTFSTETLPSEPKDNALVEEESNGLTDEKQTSLQETEEESTTEAAMETNQTEEQETMDINAEDVEHKENKEKENKENVRIFIMATEVLQCLRTVTVPSESDMLKYSLIRCQNGTLEVVFCLAFSAS